MLTVDRWLEECRPMTNEVSISSFQISTKTEIMKAFYLMEKNCCLSFFLINNGDGEWGPEVRKYIFFTRIFSLDKIKQEIDIWIALQNEFENIAKMFIASLTFIQLKVYSNSMIQCWPFISCCQMHTGSTFLTRHFSNFLWTLIF